MVSDYIYIGGLSSAIINSAAVGIYSIMLMKRFNCEANGTNIMSVWLMLGFAFFGKNAVNIQPILLGGYIYSRYQNKPFSNYLATSMLSTALAPAVSQMYFLGFHPVFEIIFSILVGIVLGFIIIPISSYAYRAHGGFNLYNVGFAAGIIAMVLVALLRNAGFEINPVALWSEGNNHTLSVFLFSTSVILIMGGIILTANDELVKIKSNMKKIIENIKEHVFDDAYTKHGEKLYLNMGIMGILCTVLILSINGQLSGPIVGGIFTIIGFACVGKTIFNIMPTIAGCFLAVFFIRWHVNMPSIMLTTLFSATLAPISSRFGPIWGVVAGFLHLNLAVKLGEVNGGLSLYNNGLAGGFVAMILIPVIFSLKKYHKNAHLEYDSHINN